MLQKVELEERRPIPTTGKTALNPSMLDAGDGSTRQDKREPSRGKTQCLWCGRGFAPRMTGGSPQRFCSTGHRQAFWIAARRWTMRAVEAGLINVDCLKVP
jgi:hypothetical protein